MLNIDAELVELEKNLADKINATDYTTKITNGASSVSTLESRIAATRSLVNQLDDERFLIQPVVNMLDCKISVTDYQTKIDEAGTSLSTIESSLARVASDLNDLEAGTINLLC